MMTHDDDLTAGALALHRGVMAARAGFNSVASAHFERAVELAPDDPNVWLWLAWMANSPDNTLRCLRRVLDLVPSHPAATAGMAWMKALASDDAKTDSAAAVSTVADVAEVSSPNPALVDVTTCAAGLEVFRATSVDDVAAPRVAFPVANVRSEAPSEPVVEAPAEQFAVCMLQPATAEDTVPPVANAPLWDEPVTANGHDDRKIPETIRLNDAPVDAVRSTARDSGNESFTADTAQRRRTDLASQAAEMPLPAHATPTAVPVAVASAPVESVADVQSRFSDVPTTSRTGHVALPAPVASSELETTFDLETLAQSFNPPAEVPCPTGRPLVMIVDDSPTVRMLVSLTLERRGYGVIAPFDGVAAIKELGSCRPDLILLDINMPRLDGYRLCKLIKKHEVTRNIPVVMLSEKDGMFDKLRGRLAGCSDYIIKPFEADVLAHKVAKYLTPATTNSL